jgi:hypothetical protein
MKNSITLLLGLILSFGLSKGEDKNPQIRFDQFLLLSEKVQKDRKSRLVDVERFLEMAAEENTIILDTRSKAAFDQIHIKGAVHLNFSDFTNKKLAKVIPGKDTRILIYCNNNFDTTPLKKRVDVSSFASKAPALALNIPTFINLSGYGYHNVYELGELLPLTQTEIALEGTAVSGIEKVIAHLAME